MNTLSYKTVSANKATVNKEWVIIDAEGKILGRLASVVAATLRGKHKTNFTPHVDCGDNVIVINAEKIVLHGKRADQKEYFHYTGYPGGGRFQSFKNVISQKPEFAIQHAVRGMLPKTKLGNKMVHKLKVCAGSNHPHAAQSPKLYDLPY